MQEKKKLNYKLKSFDCKAWYINTEYFSSRIYKKDYIHGINFYADKNKYCYKFFRELKKLLLLYCQKEIYYSRYVNDKNNNKIEFYIAFKSYLDLIRCFDKIVKFEEKIYKKISCKKNVKSTQLSNTDVDKQI